MISVNGYMASVCATCGASFPWLRRWSTETTCQKCRVEALSYYQSLLEAMVQGRVKGELASARLKKLAVQAKIDDAAGLRLKGEAFKNLLTSKLAGTTMSVEDEEALCKAAEALGVDEQILAKLQLVPADLICKWAVARVNAGRLETIAEPKVLLKKGEVAHLEVGAQLLAAHRHTTRQYGGFSFRIVSGVYYHFGSSTPISTMQLEAADLGVLTVTSQRVVFAGSMQSIELVHAKILALTTFCDGIEFNVSNRKNAPIFKLTEGFGHVVAATVNAAIQRQSNLPSS